MAVSLAEILLKVTGDTGDARDELEDLIRDMEVFDRQRAEAELEIETGKAHAELLGLKAELAALSDETIDIDIRRGLAETVMAMTTNVADLGAEASGAGGGISRLGTSIGGLGGSFAASGPALAIGAAVLTVIATAAMSVVAAITALVASLAAAAAAVGGMAVAFGAAFGPFLTLGIGAFQRFKDQADKAGTAAHSLQTAIKGIGRAFASAIGPAADAVFRGIADALRQMAPVIRDLRPAFTILGRVLGDVFRTLGREFANPQWQKFFDAMIRGAAKLAGPGAKVFTKFARILRDIAQAALPFLVRGLRALGQWLGDLRNRMGGVQGIRKFFEETWPHVVAWTNLFRLLGSIMLELFKIAAPFGEKIVKWLSRGLQEFLEWMKTKKGRQEIKAWFQAMVPVVKDLIRATVEFGLAALQWLTIISPLVSALLRSFTAILEVINSILDKLPDLIGDIKGEVRLFRDAETGEFTEQKPGKRARSLIPEGVERFKEGMGRTLTPRTALAPFSQSVPAAAAASGTTIHIHFTTPSGGSPDPEVSAAQISRRLRSRGEALTP